VYLAAIDAIVPVVGGVLETSWFSSSWEIVSAIRGGLFFNTKHIVTANHF